VAIITLNKASLQHNFNYLNHRLISYNKSWGIVTKLLCGNEKFLNEVVDLHPNEVLDSRLSNLEKLQKLAPQIQRVYIKPPPINSIKRLVSCADVSFNTHINTILKIDEEAREKSVIHKIIIMVELGDLREGVMRDNIMEFYSKVFELKNIEVIGLGTNLNCLNGILPSLDKLIQLSLYKELINAKFNSNIKWVSAGTSVTLPLLPKKQVPAGNNHFRIGETLYFGNDIMNDRPIRKMRQDVFVLRAEVIEIRTKPVVASGEQGQNMMGEQPNIELEQLGENSVRALLDVGVLDVLPKYLIPISKYVKIVGSSSDILVVDIGKNPEKLKLGDYISFRPNYNGVLSLMNSKYIDKEVI